jgi:hypothetical protein
MDKILETFISLQTIGLAFGSYMATFFTRRGVELAVVSAKDSDSSFGRWWNGFLLYLVPVLWGMLLSWSFFRLDAMPADIEHWQGAVLFGAICGWLSGMIYKGTMKALRKKLGTRAGKLPKPPEIAGASEEDK